MINWFRRKFKTSPQSEEQPSEVATPEIESTDVESEQPEATTSQEEQLLNLAKQAYANIQKRKTEESEVPIQASETTPVSEPIVEESP
ncbi:MAG: signal recognition particle-docking protein FtsY, partial [Hydrococcus sp. CSU_1_8]|nr:signal recognition particle-docking protein FtsY [Hydrococcus sp. CSU_1_8]